MDKDAITDLKSDDRLKLKALYNAYRAPFMGFGKRYHLDAATLADIYQEAFLALRKKAISGKLDKVNSSMKTYLFGIGKYMIFDSLKAKKRITSYEPQLHVVDDQIEAITLNPSEALTEEQTLLRKYFKKLGEKCRLVLTLFYYRGLSIKEIVLEAGYKDENNVKATKSRCLKQLREMINS
ncbi:MAG: sigma-70 family RNA polymerase sigma factor [Eudoraea sp.]|nr:sigma-70 family RNA polymerase sigma factor [Eudoraea sp.]